LIVWKPEIRNASPSLTSNLNDQIASSEPSESLCSFCLEFPMKSPQEAPMDIGAPETEHEIEIAPLEEPVPSPAPVEEPAQEPVPA
jgi:hypothetical protein